MSYYYKYNFVSPEPTYALIKEELKSYFDTGAVDDTLFPKYTEKCLKKLGRGSYKINETILNVEDFKATLPVDFISVREAWACEDFEDTYQLPSAEYNQVKTCSSKIYDGNDLYCNPCSACESPNVIHAIYKTTHTVAFKLKKHYLLTPGNISVRDNCAVDCANFGMKSPESFDIRDNKFFTSCRTATVYLVYYSDERTEDGYQLIPDNIRIEEYIESYIKFKIFEQLCNMVTDETYNQIEAKRARAEAEQFEKQALAEIEMKKQTVYQKRQASISSMHRNDIYRID